MLAIHAYWIHWQFYNAYNNGKVATICCQRKFPIPVEVSIGLDCTIMEIYGMEKWEQRHTRWTEAECNILSLNYSLNYLSLSYSPENFLSMIVR